MNPHKLISDLRILLAAAFAGMGSHRSLIHPDTPRRVAGKPTNPTKVTK